MTQTASVAGTFQFTVTCPAGTVVAHTDVTVKCPGGPAPPVAGRARDRMGAVASTAGEVACLAMLAGLARFRRRLAPKFMRVGL